MYSEWTQKTTVQKGGRIELVLPALVEGEQVEVVVRSETIDPPKPKRVFGGAKSLGRMSADFERSVDKPVI